MAGITTGSHLNRLLALRERINHEIAAERLRLATTPTTPRPATQLPPLTPPQPLPTPNSVIRAWARNNGYDIATTGRIPTHVIDEYHLAHNTRITTSTGDTRP